MPELSAEVRARSRKFEALALQRLASVGQVNVAEAIGKSETTVSRHVSEQHLQRSLEVLAALGLKVVPIEMQCYPKPQIEAIFELARGAMERMKGVEELTWE